MLEYTVEYTEKSLQDLCEIEDYIANELLESDIAEQKTIWLVDEADEIGLFPFKYAALNIAKQGKRGLRKKVCGEFIILYRPVKTKKLVRIIRILHGRTDWLRHI